jgi:hypothetical protein
MPDLRKLVGTARTLAIKQLALKIRTLTGSTHGVKVVLVTELADLATDIWN